MDQKHQEGAVLFVHGIGEQRRGDTLQEFGGTLVKRARQWFGKTNVREVPPVGGGCAEAPAHQTVEVARRQGPPLRLLLAESHWADEVQAPTWGVLMRWLVTTVPFVVQRAADAWMRRVSRRIDAIREAGTGPIGTFVRLPLMLALVIVRVAANVVAVALTLLVVLLLLVLGLLAKLDPVRNALFRTDSKAFPKRVVLLAVIALAPVAVLATQGGTWAIGAAIVASAPSTIVLLSLAARLRSLVVTFIGDSYALLDRSAGGSAPRIITRVAEDLAWLEGRAGAAPVVIVAHSQGAEVAHRVLRNRSARAPIAGLVTFGAGIAKLHAVGKLAGARRRSWSAFVLRWGSAACACGAVAVVGGWQDAPNERATAAALLAVAIGLLSLARKILRAIVGDEKDAIGIGGGQVQLWTDLHASHDLVSEGPLRFPDGVVGTTQAIVNGRSMLDHVTYWHNVEGFACAVARELERAADKRPGVGSSPALQDAVRSRTYVIDAMLYTARVAVATLVAWLCWTLEPGVLGVVAILAAAALVLFAVSKLTAAHIARRTDAVIAAHHRAASDRHGTT